MNLKILEILDWNWVNFRSIYDFFVWLFVGGGCCVHMWGVGRGCWGDQLRRVEHSNSDTLIRGDPPPLQQYYQTNSFNNQGWMLDSRKCLIQSYFFSWPLIQSCFVNFKSDKAIIFFNSIPFTPFQSLDGKYKIFQILFFGCCFMFFLFINMDEFITIRLKTAFNSCLFGSLQTFMHLLNLNVVESEWDKPPQWLKINLKDDLSLLSLP